MRFQEDGVLRGYAMPKIEPVIHPDNVFDPEETAALGVAYESAVGELRADCQPEFVREIIARGVLAVAMKGERDPDRLCKFALASIGVPGKH
jgi:hypothetical protein